MAMSTLCAHWVSHRGEWNRGVGWMVIQCNTEHTFSLAKNLESALWMKWGSNFGKACSRQRESKHKGCEGGMWVTCFRNSTMPKPLTVWITTDCGKFFKRWEYQTTWPASWETCMQVRKQQLQPDMEQQTGSKYERSTSRLYIVTLLI